MTIQEFADRLQVERLAEYNRSYPNSPCAEQSCKVRVRPGRKYTKVDVGGSGVYMVVNQTGEIFGIKAYGVIHRGHRYGTLDTVDDWNWGDYTASRKAG